MNTTTDQGNRNHSLQVLRGIAAAAVVIYHAAHFTDIRSGGTVRVEQIFGARLGSYGVLVFFVLSGYLMEAAVRRYDPRTFLLHRFVRLYPTFWLLCLVVFLVQSARAGAWITIPWQALTLLPLGEMPRPLGVEWTLLYEVFFYGVCTLLCFWRRAYFGVNVAWLALVVGAVFWHNQYGSTMQPTLAQIPFSGWNVGFICGGMAGYLNRSIKAGDPGAIWLGGIALVLLGELTSSATRPFLAGPGMALIVVALARTQNLQNRSAGFGGRVLFLLGEYSYGLYLAHAMAIQITLQYVSADRLTEPYAVFAGMIGVGLTAGIVAGSIDVVCYRSLKTWIDARIRRRTSAKLAVAAE